MTPQPPLRAPAPLLALLSKVPLQQLTTELVRQSSCGR